MAEKARILNTSKVGKVIRGESAPDIRNVLVSWGDGVTTWHRVIDQRTDVTLVLPEGHTQVGE